MVCGVWTRCNIMRWTVSGIYTTIYNILRDIQVLEILRQNENKFYETNILIDLIGDKELSELLAFVWNVTIFTSYFSKAPKFLLDKFTRNQFYSRRVIHTHGQPASHAEYMQPQHPHFMRLLELSMGQLQLQLPGTLSYIVILWRQKNWAEVTLTDKIEHGVP